MLEPQQLESLIRIVSSLDRPALVDRLLSFDGAFPIDFTDEYLQQLSIDRLRHILVAVCLQAGQLPVDPVAQAA